MIDGILAGYERIMANNSFFELFAKDETIDGLCQIVCLNISYDKALMFPIENGVCLSFPVLLV